jgi:hypothetical protein
MLDNFSDEICGRIVLEYDNDRSIISIQYNNSSTIKFHMTLNRNNNHQCGVKFCTFVLFSKDMDYKIFDQSIHCLMNGFPKPICNNNENKNGFN